MTRFSDITPFGGSLSRVDGTPMKSIHPNDHNNFAFIADLLRQAGIDLDAREIADVGALQSTDSYQQTLIDAINASAPMTALREPMAGLVVPAGSLENVLYSTGAPRRGAIIGDSTWQMTTQGCSFAQGGLGTFQERISLHLARAGWGQCISPGLRPIWLTAGFGWSGYTEYSIFSGAPTAVNRATAGAGDVAPFGRAIFMSHATDVIRWTKPTLGPASWWGRPIVGFEVLYIDAPGSNPAVYSVDGAANVLVGNTVLGDNKLKSVYVAKAVSSTINIHPQNAQSNFTFVGIRPYWVHPFVSTLGVDGFYIDNLGHDSNFLSSFVNPASTGDPLAILNNVTNPLGTPGVGIPPQVAWCCFTNDQSFALSSAWSNNLSTVLARVRAGGGDMIHMSNFEQASRGAGDVLTNYNGVLEYSQQHDYRAASRAWAASNAVAYLDFYEAWAARGFVGQAQANPTLCQGLHPWQAGINDQTVRLRRMLTVYA